MTYSDPWIRLRQDSCVTESGQIIEPYHVLEYTDWINVLALTKNLEIVLVKQYRHGAQVMTTELPSGRVDAADASPEAAMRRELEEETGYVGKDFFLVGTYHPNSAMQTNRCWTFLAPEVVPEGHRKLDPTEDLELELMPLGQYLSETETGKLHCQALHGSALYFTSRYLMRTEDTRLFKMREIFAARKT